MPTTVHLPAALIQAVDRRARTLKISRNRVIIRALEREIASATEWPAGFLDALRHTDAETTRGVDDLLTQVKAARRSKRPRRL
jgi:predicted transcriptional regulator